jgi:hypothetical protein
MFSIVRGALNLWMLLRRAFCLRNVQGLDLRRGRLRHCKDPGCFRYSQIKDSNSLTNMAEAPFPHGSPPWTFLRPPWPPLCCFVVLVMLSVILVLAVYCIALSVLRSDYVSVSVSVSPEVVELAELSLGELFAYAQSVYDSADYFEEPVEQAFRVHCSTAKFYGRSGRRLGGAAVVGRRARFERRVVPCSLVQRVRFAA